MAIYCCKGCTAPKRHPGCHGSCPEYIADKAEHDRLKAEYNKKQAIDSAILGDRGKKVYNAMKDRRFKKI